MRCLLFLCTMCITELIPECWCSTSHHRHRDKDTRHHPSATGNEQHSTRPKHTHSQTCKHKHGHREPRIDTATPSVATEDSHKPEYFNADVKAEMVYKGHYAECPAGQRLVCRHDPCKYHTCEDAAGGGCPLNTLDCEHDAFVCDCHNAYGYFRRNATTTQCLHKDHRDCIAARTISCGANETAVCKDAEIGCQFRNCYFFYFSRDVTTEKRKELCQWSETPDCAKKFQNCRCSNGYVLHEQTKKCVLPRDCTPYWWDNSVNNKNIDTIKLVRVRTGLDQHGGDVLVCKYDEPDTGNVLLGKFRIGHHAFPVKVTNDVEFAIVESDKRFNYVSILCMLPGALKWVPYKQSDGNLPKNALLAGYANKKPQYIGKAYYLGNKTLGTPGKIEDRVLYIGYHLTVTKHTEFDVLCVQPQPQRK